MVLKGDVVGTDTIKSMLLSLFKNFIACIHVWISGELSFANFEGLTNGTSALFFKASLAILLLSVETITWFIYFYLKACLIALPSKVVFLNFNKFLFFIPRELPLAQIKATIFI